MLSGPKPIPISKSQVKSFNLRNTGRDFSKHRSESFNYKLLFWDQQGRDVSRHQKKWQTFPSQWKTFQGRSRPSTSSAWTWWLELNGLRMRERKSEQRGKKVNSPGVLWVPKGPEVPESQAGSGGAWLHTVSLWRIRNASLQMIIIRRLD